MSCAQQAPLQLPELTVLFYPGATLLQQALGKGGTRYGNGTTSASTSSSSASTAHSGAAVTSSYGILIPLGTFALAGLACLALFCWFRTLFQDIYSPRLSLRRNRPPPLARGLLAWIPVVYGVPEAQVLRSVGMDGVMFLRFLQMGYRFFGVLTLFGLGVIAPIHYWSAPAPDWSRSTGLLYEDVLLPALSVTNVPNHSALLRAHLLFTWLISLAAYAVLAHFLGRFLHLKLQEDGRTLAREPSPGGSNGSGGRIEDRTVIVFAIPPALRHEMDLAAYFEGLGLGRVENVVLCRRWSGLREAVRLRAEALDRLERAFARALSNHAARHTPSWARRVAKWWREHRPRWRSEATGGRSPFYAALPTHTGVALGSQAALGDSGAATFHARQSDVDVALFEMRTIIDAVDPACRPTLRPRPGWRGAGRQSGAETGGDSRTSGSRWCWSWWCGWHAPRVDAWSYWAERLRHWDERVQELRRCPETSAPTRVAFVTFEAPLSALLAAQAVVHSNPFCVRVLRAPEPRDVYWPNLSHLTAHDHVKVARSLFVWACLFLLVFFSTAIVTTIAGLIDLQRLALYLPGLALALQGIPEARLQFLQGVIPTILLATWTSCLPSLLLYLCQVQGLEAQSWIERSLLGKYFFYLLWNVVVVQVLVRAILFDILQSPASLIELLGHMIPKSAPILINYVMLQAATIYPAQLVLAGPLVLTWFTRLAPWTRSSPRQVANSFYPSVLTSVNYGIAYPVPILLFVIGLVYAPITPLILPFTAAFFALTYFVFKYLLLYVHLKGYEGHGAATLLAVKYCFVGLLLFQLSMMGVLALKAVGPVAPGTGGGLALPGLPWSGYVQMVVGVSPLLVLTGLVYGWYVRRVERVLVHPPLDVVGRAGVGRPATSAAEPVSVRVDQTAITERPSSDAGQATGEEVEAEDEEEGAGLFESYYRHSLAVAEEEEEEPPASLEAFFEPEPELGPSMRRTETPATGEDEAEGEEDGQVFHVEPPCTRVVGVLDPGFALLREREDSGVMAEQPEQADPLEGTYIHPCFVGRLPLPWLPGRQQPREVMRVRAEERARQEEHRRKWQARQRLGRDAQTSPLPSSSSASSVSSPSMVPPAELPT